MAATKKMVIRVILDGANDLRFTTRQTRANLATLEDLFGDPHTIVPRNPHGRKGSPETRAAREAAKKVSKRTKKDTVTA